MVLQTVDTADTGAGTESHQDFSLPSYLLQPGNLGFTCNAAFHKGDIVVLRSLCHGFAEVDDIHCRDEVKELFRCQVESIQLAPFATAEIKKRYSLFHDSASLKPLNCAR